MNRTVLRLDTVQWLDFVLCDISGLMSGVCDSLVR
jgi:hypothetical protein